MKLIFKVFILLLLVPSLSIAAAKSKKVERDGTPSRPSKEETEKYIVDFMQNYQVVESGLTKRLYLFDNCNLKYESHYPEIGGIYTGVIQIARMSFSYSSGDFGGIGPSTKILMLCEDNNKCVKLNNKYYDSQKQKEIKSEGSEESFELFINNSPGLGGKLVKAFEHLRTLCGGKNELF